MLKKTICPLDCPDSCGMEATLDNGKVTGLQGAKDHPNTNGFLCRKMRRYHERVYSPDRILYPQVRVGKKGEGRFKRISWDEAWDILTDKLTSIREEYGGEALLPYSYAGNMGQINRWAGYPFFHKYGASRLDHTICSAAAGAAWNAHCNGVPGRPPEVAADSDLIVAWGVNVKITNIHFWPFITQSRRKGGKLIVIDPHRYGTAKSADEHLQVLPGGDSALALGAMKSILEKGKENRSFIEAETTGFQEMARYLEKTPWASFERDSGISQEQIESFADVLIEHPKTFLRIGIGLSRNSRGAMSIRAITCLAAILGLYEGGEGRGVLASSGAFRPDKAKLTHPQLAVKTTRLINMIQLGHALTGLQPPVKGLFVYNSNPLSVAPDASMVRQGLSRDDLFTVVHEQVMTPTARYADLLLPATTSLENQDLYTSYGHFQVGVVDPVIEPQGEAKSNFELFQTLAQKMGYTDAPFYQTVSDRIQEVISDMKGLPEGCDSIDDLKGKWITSDYSRIEGSIFEHEKQQFNFSISADPTISKIPCLMEATEFDDPDAQSRYPFQLMTPPIGDMLNSTFGEKYQDTIGEVVIHPDDAITLGVQSGQLVKLENDRGHSVRKVLVSDDTRQEVVVAPGIYWESSDSGQTGINDLTSQKLTDMGGGGIFHESRVKVTPITE